MPWERCLAVQPTGSGKGAKSVVSCGPYSQRHVFGESIQGDSEIENGKFDIVFESAVWLSSLNKGLAG